MSVLYIRNAVTGKFEPVRTIKGNTGEDGGYYTPAVDSDGNLTWTASKAGMPDIPGANIKGPEGTGGLGSAYTLPIASAAQLGGVMPAAKTDEMTQAVGVDDAGGLWTVPGVGSGGGGDAWELLLDVTTEELVNTIEVSQYPDGNTLNLKKVCVMCNTKQERTDGESFTGTRNITFTVNGSPSLAKANTCSSGDSFVDCFAYFELICGHVEGNIKKITDNPVRGDGNFIHTIYNGIFDTIQRVVLQSAFTYNAGRKDAFSVGSKFKVYGVRA